MYYKRWLYLLQDTELEHEIERTWPGEHAHRNVEFGLDSGRL
jgi:hypothetical protein